MVSASYMKNQTKDDANAWSFGTKYAYPLSKRTRLYAGVEAVFNDSNAGYAIEAGPRQLSALQLRCEQVDNGLRYGLSW